MSWANLQRELALLTTRSIEGDLTGEQQSDLTRLLEQHPKLIDDYVEAMFIRSSLHTQFDQFKADRLLESCIGENIGPATMSRRVNRPRRLSIGFAAAAAVVLLAAMVWVFSQSDEPSTASPNRPTQAHRADQPAGAPLATLVATENVVWDSEPIQPGQELVAQTLRIKSGRVGFALVSGTEVQLHGQSTLRIDDSMHVTLTQGRVDFSCPPGAEGFTVQGPQGVRVVDLGTRFSMQSQPSGPSRVHVTEGRVRIEQPGMATPIELTTGRSVHIDPQAHRVYSYVVEHLGVQDPLQMVPAWSLEKGDSTRVGPVREPSASGEQGAWLIEDHGTAPGQVAMYSYKLTDQQVRRPWRAVARVRVIESTGDNQVLHVDDGERRWAMWLHPDRIATRNHRAEFIDLATGLDLTSKEHLIEIVYANDEAVFLLDGNEIGRIQREKTMGRMYQPQIRFGAGSSLGTGSARWSFVRFAPEGDQINSH
ncbi:FecR domain-containing protein [Planctomycetales bacterium ZRK34]|nr:FecR domain-containing protein [Planctomycetales bacterium ZRK34]